MTRPTRMQRARRSLCIKCRLHVPSPVFQSLPKASNADEQFLGIALSDQHNRDTRATDPSHPLRLFDYRRKSKVAAVHTPPEALITTAQVSHGGGPCVTQAMCAFSSHESKAKRKASVLEDWILYASSAEGEQNRISAEAKKAHTREQNRISAQKSRQKKARHIQLLNATVEQLASNNVQLQVRVDILQNHREGNLPGARQVLSRMSTRTGMRPSLRFMRDPDPRDNMMFGSVQSTGNGATESAGGHRGGGMLGLPSRNPRRGICFGDV
ncbi:hypothetical protein F4804DRAFT_337826 [Jackrogersella minutella]|nr:hypothetical protein F4804DRAFT_337826 [Jackrogersella minutella]